MSQTKYDKHFYDEQQALSYRSARAVFPALFSLIPKPGSVLDVGCGLGTWLSALEKDWGIVDYLGVDGDYVQRDALLINPQNFRAHDLTKPYAANRRFGLAMSLEVGEHLPDEHASTLVQTLTAGSDVVLFSAALPGQRGTYHINEQFPEYWAEKFAAEGFAAIDALRKPLWHNREVALWYRQNMLLFIRTEALPQYLENPALKAAYDKTDPQFLTRIHPELLAYNVRRVDSLRTASGFISHKIKVMRRRLAGGC